MIRSRETKYTVRKTVPRNNRTARTKGREESEETRTQVNTSKKEERTEPMS